MQNKLDNNQNSNNPRQRVNTEALQEELDRIENGLKNLKTPNDITENVLRKLVGMTSEELAQYKDKLAQRVDSFNKENRVEDSQAA